MRLEMVRKTALHVLTMTLLGLLVGCASNTVQPAAAPATSTTPATTAAPAATSTKAASTAVKPAAAAPTAAPAAAPLAAATQLYEIPAGTLITVRLNDTLASNVSTSGQSFTATVVDAIQVNQRTLIAQGATATGTVVDAQPLGRFAGGARLQLRLDSVDATGHSA